MNSLSQQPYEENEENEEYEDDGKVHGHGSVGALNAIGGCITVVAFGTDSTIVLYGIIEKDIISE